MGPTALLAESRLPRRQGHSLLEISLALALLGAGSWALTSAARRVADRSAVRGAREEVAGLLARARREAILYGGSEVVLTVEPPRASLFTDGSRSASTPDLRDAYGVSLDPGGGGETVRLRWDGFGLGRMTSRTVRFRRGRARADLVISGRGRLRRR
ncbi:MAG: hypothetical protein GWM92_10035 [Gemmatimonadetes bacterium]|nr:hypothetical protein [Gemmatimonadota bacterium]NIR79013.1 hypothetical protein [Gemmatimonadota bacterium]NIT87657.1 hypothetical protein [Gemmatimonadota bacterium]NIU31524.1 hypothetical protein [Gemmatimonadota bacterium]NIU36184.1 hypothetical protein [Gemmatimonadota bacterium]